MLKITGLQKKFGKDIVLDNINLEVKKGEIVVLVGPSGGGKTTLLRLLNSLESADKGTILINNKALYSNGIACNKNTLKEINKDIGLVFQNYNLFPHLSILENMIMAPILVNKVSKAVAEEESLKILKFLGLDGKENSYPYQLSGGQQQRVAIGRALALNPKLICFDEPTSALDPHLTEEVSKLIFSLKEKGMTVLAITHDMSFARTIADRVISINKGVIINSDIYSEKISG